MRISHRVSIRVSNAVLLITYYTLSPIPSAIWGPVPHPYWRHMQNSHCPILMQVATSSKESKTRASQVLTRGQAETVFILSQLAWLLWSSTETSVTVTCDDISLSPPGKSTPTLSPRNTHGVERHCIFSSPLDSSTWTLRHSRVVRKGPLPQCQGKQELPPT